MIARRRGQVVGVVFRPSPAARVLVHGILLVLAAVVVVRTAAAKSASAVAVVALAAGGVALSVPFLLDLWAEVAADDEGVTWRNKVRRRRLPWAEVAGFERGGTSMELHRRDGQVVALRALGLRYFGSKKLAAKRVAALEGLRSASTGGRR